MHGIAAAVRIWSVATCIAAVSLIVALAVGTQGFGPGELWGVVSGREQGIAAQIVFELRLPRAATAWAVGALLAVAGAVMQVLLRNPLADPYVLGLSGGAAAGALGAMLLGLGGFIVTGAAGLGALVSVALVLSVARGELLRGMHPAGGDTPARLLLSGIALATGWSALVTLILTLAPETSLRGMLFWLLGDLDGAEHYGPALLGLGLVMIASSPLLRALNVLARGANTARALGVAVGPVQMAAFLLASVATALAVTTAGTIGFVGLIVPHGLRLLIGNDQRVLLPTCALVGGAVLVLADTIARTIAAPLQLPVGAIMAMIGVPVFLLLLHRSGRVR